MAINGNMPLANKNVRDDTKTQGGREATLINRKGEEMAKIDLSLIKGYEEMSAEDKVKAFENYEFDTSELEQLRADNKKKKDLIDKYTGELSSLKKEKNAGLTEAEQKARETEEALSNLQAKYDELYKQSTVSAYTAKYVALGYDEELAKETANALVEGDMDKVFVNSEKFKTSLEKQFKAEAARNMPRPDSKGTSTSTPTKESIMKIKDPVERQNAIAQNLNLFTGE